MRFLFISFIVVFVTICRAEWNTKDYLRREHTLVKPYTTQNWDIAGSAFMMTNQVRLTANERSRQGGLWNEAPVRCHNWEIHVQFKVTGATGDLYGDGFAFWYVKDTKQIGNVFGSKDQFKGLGVFFDTYSNHHGPHHHSHPYISAMVNNGTYKYDHDSDGTHTQLDGCEAQFRNKPYDTFFAIRYSNNVLTVSVDIDNKSGWKRCFRVENVKLPVFYHIGFSAATGDLTDQHDIIYAKFFELEPEDPNERADDYVGIEASASTFEPPREHVTAEMEVPSWSGWRWFLTILFIFVAIAIVGYAAHYYSKERTFNRKKRLF